MIKGGIKLTKAMYEAMRKKAAEEQLKASKAVAQEAAEKAAARLKSQKQRDRLELRKSKGIDPTSNIKSPQFTGPKPKSKTWAAKEAKEKATEGQNIFRKTLGNRSTPDAKAKALLKKDKAALKKEYDTTDKDLIERIKEGRKYRAEQQSIKDAKAKKAGSYSTADRPGRKPGDTEAWAGWGRYGKAGKPKYKKGGKIGMGMTKNNYKKGGKVSSCSKRADGCAVKGKTKGRMI